MRLSFLLSFFLTSHLFAQSGVGTTNPKSKLHVLGDTASPAKSGNAQNSLLRLSNNNNIGVLDMGVSKDNYAWIQSRDSSDYSAGYPLFLIPNGGNLAIGSTTASEKLTVNGSVMATGSIRSTADGQLLNSVFLNESDLGISSNITNSSTTETTVATYTYTPVSARSKIYIEFDSRAIISGSTGDELATHIYVGSNKIQTNTVLFSNGQGGGGRGNSLFPIQGDFQNSSTSNLTITIKMQRVSSDDTITVFPDLSLIIQEVAR